MHLQHRTRGHRPKEYTGAPEERERIVPVIAKRQCLVIVDLPMLQPGERCMLDPGDAWALVSGGKVTVDPSADRAELIETLREYSKSKKPGADGAGFLAKRLEREARQAESPTEHAEN